MKTGRKISDLKSLVLNMSQARSDCDNALEAYMYDNRPAADMYIGAAIEQLESARARLKRQTGNREGGGQ